jgi:hypothetical protein
VRQSAASNGVTVERLTKWLGGILVWLALVTQVGAPAAAALAMADLADPLAHFVICTSDGPVTIPDRHGPPRQPSCCDTLCQLANAGHALLAPLDVSLAPPGRGALDVAYAIPTQASRLKSTLQTNARAPPGALLIAV